MTGQKKVEIQKRLRSFFSFFRGSASNPPRVQHEGRMFKACEYDLEDLVPVRAVKECFFVFFARLGSGDRRSSRNEKCQHFFSSFLQKMGKLKKPNCLAPKTRDFS